MIRSKKRIPLGPNYHAEPGDTKGHQHDVYTTKGELHGYTRIHVGTLMKSAVEDLAACLRLATAENARLTEQLKRRAEDDSAAVVGIPELVRQGRDKWFALGEDGKRFNLVLTPTP